jgi:hypothetical protein
MTPACPSRQQPFQQSQNQLIILLADAIESIARKNIASVSRMGENAQKGAFASTVITNLL